MRSRAVERGEISLPCRRNDCHTTLLSITLPGISKTCLIGEPGNEVEFLDLKKA